MDEASVGRVLDLAYGAAVDPELWPGFLEAFADAMGGASAALVWQDQRSRRGQGLAARLDPGVLPTYFGAFATRHPSQRWQNSPRDRVRHFVPHIVADDDAMPKAELVRTPFYNEFMRPFGLHSVLRLGLTAHGDDAAFLMVSRTAQKDRFGEPALGLARRLHQHVIRAFDLGQKVVAQQPRRLAGEAGLAASPHALFVVEADGRVLYANPAAEALMTARIGVGVVGGRLSAASSRATQQLHGLIARAGAATPWERRGGAMTLISLARRLPIPVSVAPLRAEASVAIRQAPTVLVCVNDLETPRRLSEERLRDIFGLSPAEARVAAALFEGDTPREAAERLGISFYTVRGHLVRIFEKTGVSRQAELTKLLAAAGDPWMI
ncbi:MAG: hypothetical protein GC203_04430 [Phenylobacterium sp.]|uniref:helix-turn-helix transcriptional regulator n=1 Tax=Phenylobacterium sp. TaxID=1871053 RepID=UPI0025E9A9BD|nr:helix-turn-helix transcriptional regulator [Phenylobacterium sp.]MBI1197090.1 hypothetical protein [Phenylobacterium sp.]